MSYRDLRNLTETLRATGFPRQVSLENFRTNNFQLVAEILRWLLQKFDPSAEIPFDTDTEQDRIMFMKATVELLAEKSHLKLNSKKLYRADLNCVRELLKGTSLLYNALQANIADDQKKTSLTDADFNLNSKLNDLKQTRSLASEITNLGAKLYDLLGDEVELREERTAAIAKPLEIGELERKVEKALGDVQARMQKTLSMLDNLSADEANIAQKIEKRKSELERNQKRLQSLQSVRPAFMDEYEKVEESLKATYEEYVAKHRNLSYLEDQLEEYNRMEKEKFEETEQSLRRMQAQWKEDEKAMLGDLVDDDDAASIGDDGDDDFMRGTYGDQDERINSGRQAEFSGTMRGTAFDSGTEETEGTGDDLDDSMDSLSTSGSEDDGDGMSDFDDGNLSDNAF